MYLGTYYGKRHKEVPTVDWLALFQPETETVSHTIMFNHCYLSGFWEGIFF